MSSNGQSMAVSLGVVNLFDQDVPWLASDFLTSEARIHDPRGRQFQLGFRYRLQ